LDSKDVKIIVNNAFTIIFNIKQEFKI